MNTEWKDATSYSHGERGVIDPTSWECTVSGVRLWVSCGHTAYRGVWIMNCDTLGIREKVLAVSDNTADDAKRCAISLVRSCAEMLISRLQKLLVALEDAA